MRIKHLLAISILAVSMTAMAQTGKGGTWTLGDCLDYAIKNNISLQKQQLNRLSAVEDVKQSQKPCCPHSVPTHHRWWDGDHGLTTKRPQ